MTSATTHDRRLTTMVMLVSLEPIRTYELVDREGRIIGQVVQPAESGLVGHGTMLLRRPAPVPATHPQRPPSAA